MLVAEITLTSVLTDIGSVFTSLIGYVSNICETIVSNPLLLIGFCIPFAFAIVSFVKRLF
ncbi:MAG: hypothetical protein ACI4VL_02875 [Bacilli bacterium]